MKKKWGYIMSALGGILIILLVGSVFGMMEDDGLDNREVYDPQEDFIEEEFNQQDLKYYGYIIEFEDESIIEMKNKLDEKAEDAEEYIQEHPILSTITTYRFWVTTPEKVSSKVEKYSKDLKDNNNKIRQKVLSEIKGSRSKITGNVISDLDSEIEVIGEFDVVFNGIALNISDGEAEEIKKIEGVKSVSPNLEVHATLMDSVPLIQGDILAGNLDEDGNDCTVSGKYCLTGEGVTIGIIDTGIDYTHDDLGGCTSSEFLSGNCDKVIGGYDFVNNDNDPMDDRGHGTHCAGIAAGSGDGGLKGIAPDARLYAYKVLDSGGSGWSTNIIAAIERSVDLNENGIPCEDENDYLDVISLSLGGSGDPDDEKSTAIDNAALCTIPVIAAGNSGPSKGTVKSPGTARDGLTIGASDKNNVIASFSSRGPVEWDTFSLNKPDILAPGVDICAAQYNGYHEDKKCLDDNHIAISGTSMATPHVAGAVALIKQKNPDWITSEIKALIKSTALDLGYDIDTQGSGLINLPGALSIITKPPIAEIKTLGLVYGEELDIIGSAKSENFQKYELFYISREDLENGLDWTKIFESSFQVSNNVLYSWDIKEVSEGDYFLKLVVSSSEWILEDTNFIGLYQQRILSPKSLDDFNHHKDSYKVIYDKDELIEIKGVVGGYNFDYYDIKWCDLDSICSTEGISLTDNGENPISNNILGYWDIPNRISSGYYDLVLDNSYNGEVHSDSVRIYVEAEFQEGWPKSLYDPMPQIIFLPLCFFWEPVLADVDGDGGKEIILTFGNWGDSYIYVYKHDGTFLEGFPVRAQGATNGYFQRAGAVGDITGDGKNEIVVGDNDGYLHIIKDNGEYLTTPKEIGFGSGLPSIGDINGDGKNEIIIGDAQGKLSVIDEYINYLPGWPKNVMPPRGASAFSGIELISIADLNNDGVNEIITVIEGCAEAKGCSDTKKISVYVIDSEANTLLGWPKTYKGELKSEINIIDFNKDSYKDIVFSNGLYTFSTNYEGSYIHALDYLGNELNGFPYDTGDRFPGIGAVVVGDIDNDGNLDLVYGHRDIYVLNEYLQLRDSFPVNSPTIKNSELTLGNLVYGTNQIIPSFVNSPSSNSLFELPIFNQDGSVSVKKPLDAPIYGSQSVGDLDGDGDNELVVMTTEYDLYVWDLGGDPMRNEWPMVQHDPQHTGNYHFQQETQRQSRITNNKNSAITGQLVMKLQKKDGDNWQDFQTIINKEITIPANSNYDLGDEWNNQNIIIDDSGQYRAYTSFDKGTKIENFYNFDVLECIPQCSGKECGDDGCGGSCGGCSIGESCQSGLCLPECVSKTCSELEKECGTWDDECESTIYCGDCPTGKSCLSGSCLDEGDPWLKIGAFNGTQTETNGNLEQTFIAEKNFISRIRIACGRSGVPVKLKLIDSLGINMATNIYSPSSDFEIHDSYLYKNLNIGETYKINIKESGMWTKCKIERGNPYPNGSLGSDYDLSMWVYD